MPSNDPIFTSNMIFFGMLYSAFATTSSLFRTASGVFIGVRAAREAASQDGALTAPPARRIREAVGVIRLIENDQKSDLTLFDSEGLPS
jgi:hypothetical protein